MTTQTYNLLDFEENLVLENATLEQIESFLEDKDSSLFLLEEII
jgi:hypothetical protein